MRTIIVGLGAVVMAGGLWSASVVSQGLADEPAAPSSSSEATGGAAGTETGGSEAVPPVVEREPGPPPETGEVQERTVSLTQAVHFTDVKGQDVVVGPGSYRVDAEGTNRIRLVPAETGGAVVVEAISLTHQQTVESRVPVTIPGEDPDVIHIVLVLPNGQALDAPGSYSGALSRAVTRAPLTAVTVQQALAAQGVIKPGPIFRSAMVLLPRDQVPIQITYEVRAGNAIFQEDIDLGPESQLGLLGHQGSVSWNVGGLGEVQQPLSVKTGRETLWPGGVVPYEIDSNSIPMGHRLRTIITQGVTDWNRTNVKFVSRNGELDHVIFKRVENIPGRGNSTLGRKGGRQNINLEDTAALSGNPMDGASFSTAIHEMGHTVGLWHEQARMDRDSYVEVLWDNIQDEKDQFARHVKDGIDLGPYDMTSRMHYNDTFLGKTDPVTGQKMTTMRSRIPGQLINPSEILSANDVAGINQLYPPVDCGRIPVLYQDVNSGHPSFSLEFSQPNLGSKGFGDKGSSLCVPVGWTVTLYADSDYHGDNVTIQGPAMFQDLHRDGPNGKNWGDRVSAVRVEGAQANPPPPDCATAPILFEHDHYVGRRFTLTNNAATLGTWSFGDNISSVCVPIGWTVRLYQHSSYTGDVLTVNGPMNLSDLQRESPGGRDWGDMFSSAAVTGPAANLPPAACDNNPILFEHDNYRGRLFDLREHVPDLKLNKVMVPGPFNTQVATYPNSFNDKASSLCVPAGWMITLYEHPNYKGQAVLITPSQNWGDLQRNGPGGQNWGDKVSSVAVARVPIP